MGILNEYTSYNLILFFLLNGKTTDRDSNATVKWAVRRWGRGCSEGDIGIVIPWCSDGIEEAREPMVR